MLIASECTEPLISLIQSDVGPAVESGVCAFEKLLDNERLVEYTADYDVVDLLVGLVFSGSNNRLIEACISTLIKLGKDRTPCKLDMVKAGIIDNCLELLPTAPIELCSLIAELLCILTNSSVISKSLDAAKIVEPLFLVLLRPDISLWFQHSALQALVNILEKPQSLTTLQLTPSQVIEPLISFLESPSQPIQQLGTELLNHLLAQEHYKQDIMTTNAVVPLVRLAGIGILDLQQTAVKALENISLSWPKAVADASVTTLNHRMHCGNRLHFSTRESTITVALKAFFQESCDPSSAELMTEVGATDALLDLLRSHKCEEPSGRLLESLFNNMRVREMKASKKAIAPLAQYLLDPQTRSQSGKLLAVLALGNLFQREGLARASDSVTA
ncbi:hypothetical protein RHGRI_038600 [Rhododendron griersonianum]|uniref:ARM repeat superfamily protein n=1 Tax=Rhododendron griersonianum TaxID=479676 RepID=A0AAV6HJ80_9ERIC|nr:hypothetical protein RHGRI_038600 [Rhododendron griersonianum]